MHPLTEVFWTVLAGVSVFVTGQVLLRLVIDPIQQFWGQVGEIAHSLTYFANVFGTLAETDKKSEAKVAYREHAAKLRARAYAIVWYWFWSQLRIVPPKSDVTAASGSLIALSNLTFDTAHDAGANSTRAEERVRKLLRIKEE